MTPQDDKTQNKPVPEDKPRWRIQKTAPIEVADLDSSAIDLHFPENIRQEVEYNDTYKACHDIACSAGLSAERARFEMCVKVAFLH